MDVLTAFSLLFLLLGTVSNAQETDGDCPDLECDLVCRNGFNTDADGCELCECNPCPQVICAIVCENGLKTDSDGCIICECNEDNERCPALICEESCQYGRIVGEDGCLSCDCQENPCQCQVDQVCVITAQLEWKCVERPGENETCEREDKEEKEKSGSKSGSKSKSRSHSHSKSKSRSHSKSKSRSHSHSKSKSRSHSHSKSKSRSHSHSKSKSRSHSHSKSKSRSHSHSHSHSKSKSNSTTNSTREYSKSKDRSGTTGKFRRNSLSERLLRLLSSKSEKEEEKEERRSIAMASRGAASRNIFRNIETKPDSCQSGFFCEETSSGYGTCSPIRKDGPCYNISENPEEECDDTGYFKLRICYENDDDNKECICVNPETGTRYEDTREVIDDDDEVKLNCIDRVFSSCAVTYDDRVYRVKHGKSHFDRCNCRVCTCYFGELYCEDSLGAGCRSSDECSNSSVQSSCTLQNGTVTLEHGESVENDCNRCFCRNGRLICTKYPICGNSGDECEQCKLEPVSKVCGPNGRTYPNLCTAVNCSGWDPMEILDGPCASHNPCDRFPCETGEFCLRRGGVSCLAQGGCVPSDVRACVNITQLPCDFTTTFTSNPSDNQDDGQIGSGDIDPDNTAVCGSDGNSYLAICHIIPNYPRIYVIHAGRCNDTNCRGGSVCGSDGVTYENICALRSQSSNARVDYRSECIESSGSVEEYCRAVTEEDLCEYSTENCDNLVQPASGCCPICGSVIVLLLDLEVLQDAAMIDPTLLTLDDLIGRLLQAEFFTDLFERCSFEGLLTYEGHAEIIVRPVSSDDVEFCNIQAERIVEIINSRMLSTGRKRQSDDDIQLTSSFQYVLEAGISPSTSGDDDSSAAVVSATITTVVVTFLFTSIVQLF